MIGASVAARYIAMAVTSEAVKEGAKQAARKLASSSTVKQAGSTIVLEAMLPGIKNRVEQRFQPDPNQGVQRPVQADPHSSSFDQLGEWYDPSQLGMSNEVYVNYLQAQIRCIGEFEYYMLNFESDAFESHRQLFAEEVDDPLLHIEAVGISLEIVEQFENHLKAFCIHDEEYYDHVVSVTTDMDFSWPGSWPETDNRLRLRMGIEFLNELGEYVNRIVSHPLDSHEFDEYIGSYGAILPSSPATLELLVLSNLIEVEYYAEYALEDPRFEEYLRMFELPQEKHYEFVKAENEMLKSFERRE